MDNQQPNKIEIDLDSIFTIDDCDYEPPAIKTYLKNKTRFDLIIDDACSALARNLMQSLCDEAEKMDSEEKKQIHRAVIDDLQKLAQSYGDLNITIKSLIDKYR